MDGSWGLSSLGSTILLSRTLTSAQALVSGRLALQLSPTPRRLRVVSKLLISFFKDQLPHW